ncbi:MAG TPA: nuclear transport factor 2 family protein [Gaiellaceae bacterium]|nr:nuclear transport factor 2 family protein [Gaiellaceae bacterium]
MAIRDELEVINERFSEALAGQDADAVVDLYTDDARLLFTGIPMIRGREAIARMMRAWLAESPHQMTFQTGDLWEAGNIVVDVGTYDSPHGAGKYVVLYERQADGSLKLAVDAVSLNGDAS